MDWYAYPSFIVAVLAIITIIKGEKNAEDIKKNVLITVIKGVWISLLILSLEMALLYVLNSDGRFFKFWNEIVLPYTPKLYLVIFLSVTITLYLFPYFSRDSISFERYSDKYSLESKSPIANDFNIELFCFIEKSWVSRKLLLLKHLIRVSLFLSMVISILFLKMFQPTVQNDPKYPYVTNEKIFIKTTTCIPITEVKDKKISIQSIPKGTLFSIPKGTNFSFELDKLDKAQKWNGDIIYNRIYGLPENKNISLDSHSLIYYEQEVDYTLYEGDSDDQFDKYFNVKTVPGKTNRYADSKVKYTVVSDPTKKNKKNFYEFVVGYTTNDVAYTKFLQETFGLNSIVFLIVILLIIIMTPSYLYLVINLFLSMIFIVIGIILFVEFKFDLLISLIISLPSLIFIRQIILYSEFLKNNILIRKMKGVDEINLKIKGFKKKIFIDDEKNEKKDNIGLKYPWNRFYPIKFSYYDENKRENNKGKIGIYFYDSIKDLFKIINEKK